MKQIIIFTFLFSSICYSQTSSSSEKALFKVKGVCEMCEERIEKGTVKLKGVKYADWDILSNNISLIYNSKKIDLDKIHIDFFQLIDPIAFGIILINKSSTKID